MPKPLKRWHSTTYKEDGTRWIRYWNHIIQGRPGFPVRPEKGDGLRMMNREKVAPGYVLYSPDHSKKFLLLNLDGEIVHEWPAFTSHFGYLLPNGHLLLDTEFSPDRDCGVLELDWNGKEVWFHEAQVHHDFQRLDNGNTMIVCQREVDKPEICARTLLSTYLIEVDPAGKTVWEWHSEEHIEELKRLTGQKFPVDNPDWTHSNTVCVLPETPAARDRRFKPGNVMVSHRNLDTAIVIERETGEIVWAWGPGTMDKQHATIMLPNGHMICFDNGSGRKWSAVWEVEPISGRIVWSYKGDPPTSFFAAALSNAQRLPNGNTFICSGSQPDFGRLFEVTPQGEIVWDFQNPYAEYAEGQKIVYRAYKYPPEMIEKWLRR
ncbi:MAG: aryl-sulfate sulfotransferase [Candidatus Sumerlaeota bacterium]|nr:aryl-sulfate sulfotransferase [Candidatus Sumerlaeota bacterium]